ncbi:MAG TPA: nucleotidyltransferase family protein [Pyrinomonadaceae bacterium]|jgi:hypothetical protein|nr:nucleotidyltransferase family protein [Pyrinomonadaceae bacterium]
MKEIHKASRGTLLSTILAGSWRASSPLSLNISEQELDEVTPLLYGSGGAALGWRQVRQTPLSSTSSGQVLHQAYRLQILQSAIHEEKIKTVFRLFRESSIEAILVKGWAAANLYPEKALRPYGDIDLCVRPSDYKSATNLLASPEATGCWVDLHKGFSEIKERSVEQLFERSQLLALDGEQVRVLSNEDHLALLSIHLLKHGAWRPLWLCDIGAALEGLSPDFNWDTCLGVDKKRSGWIACSVKLAEYLLGSKATNQPESIRKQIVPRWLIQNVLRQWESPFAINQPPMNHPMTMTNQLRHPTGLWKAFRVRWPNPILATVSVNGKFNRTPRWPYQLGNCFLRLGQFLSHSSD